MFTTEDFNRKVEEEVQRRIKEIQNGEARQTLKGGNATFPEHRGREIELDICREDAIASNPARSPVLTGLAPPCESPQRHSKDFAPRDINHSTAPQQILEQPRREEGSQIRFAHAQAESTQYLHSHELHESPPVPQPRDNSFRELPLRTPEGRARDRKRFNKGIKVAIEKRGCDGDKLRFRRSKGRNSDNKVRRDPKFQNKTISRAYVAAARKALDRDDQDYALELLQHAVSRNPQNARLLEL
jgi:hypothetical protein